MQNVKGVNSFDFEFPQDGCVVIGGRNNQGKTSILNGIAYAAGGEKMRPTNYKKMNSDGEPYMRCEFDNGIVAERVGESADLRVIDETGAKKGQRLLDSFCETFALNLPKFLNGTEKDRNAALLQTIGIGDELEKLDEEEAIEYEERTVIGRIADQKEKAVKELPYYPDMPEEEIKPSELMARLNEIHVKNAKAEAARREIEENKRQLESLVSNGEQIAKQLEGIDADAHKKIKNVSDNVETQKKLIEEQIIALRAQMEQMERDATTLISDIHKSAEEQKNVLAANIATNDKAIAQMVEKIEAAESVSYEVESTAEVEKALREVEETNEKVRANKVRAEKQKDADESKKKYDEKTARIEEIRRKRDTLLEGADLPYPGLSYQNKHIYLNGIAWDCISESKKYIVACAIVMRINPNCKFVLMDKLEQLDSDTLAEFDKWVRDHGLQVIATRVTSNADECTIIIKDGYIEGMEHSIIVPHKIKRCGKVQEGESQSESQQMLPINDTPTAKALTQEFSAEREELISEDVERVVKSASDAVSRAKALLAKRRGEILAQKQGEKNNV